MGEIIENSILHYKVLKRIGMGGQGSIYAALDTKLKRSVVLKILRTDIVNETVCLPRFVREAQFGSILDHPNICQVYDFQTIGETHFIVMPRINGKTMRQIIKKRPLSLNIALNIAIQLADALNYVHLRGIAHLDVKPGNVMLMQNGTVKLLDFGVAHFINENLASLDDEPKLTRPVGRPYGTPTYAAPEQALGEAADHRSDIFSAGALLYEMLAGSPAFQGKKIAEVREKVIRAEPLPIAKKRREPIPPRLEAIIKRAMAKEPADRYQNIALMRNELAAVLRGITAEFEIELNSKFARLDETNVRDLMTGSVLENVLRWAKGVLFNPRRQKVFQ